MEMLPNDVRQHRFRKSVRGYDTDEVDQFVEHVAAVLEEALGGRQRAEEKVNALEKDLRRFRDQEDALKKAVLTVEHAMAQARESTAKEGESLMRAAEQKARQIIHEAELERRRMENDLRFLKESRRSFLDQIRAFYYAQLKTLESIDGPDRAREAVRQAVQPPKRTPPSPPMPQSEPPEAKVPSVRESHAPKPEQVPSTQPPKIDVEPAPITLAAGPEEKPATEKPQNREAPRETRPWEPRRIEREDVPVRADSEPAEAPTHVPRDPERAAIYPPSLVPQRKGDGES